MSAAVAKKAVEVTNRRGGPAAGADDEDAAGAPAAPGWAHC